MERVLIRALLPDDAEAVAALSASLGYPAAADKVRTRIAALAGSEERRAFVAVLERSAAGEDGVGEPVIGPVVGWIEASFERHLQSDPFVVIGGLVVHEQMRGRRIGQQLCQAVEAWASAMGVGTLRVRSQQKRTDAHRFYQRCGYTQIKLSAVFEKTIAG